MKTSVENFYHKLLLLNFYFRIKTIFVKAILLILFVNQFGSYNLKMNFRVFLVFFLIFSLHINAQNEWHRDDFITTLREDIKSDDSRHFARVGDSFLYYFIDKHFTPNQEDLIYHLITSLRDIRFNDAKDFYGLFRLLNAYADGTLNQDCFNSFLNSSLDVISNFNYNSAKSYLSDCSNVLVDRVLYASKTFKWKFGEGDINFVYDSIPKVYSSKILLYCVSTTDSITIQKTQGYIDLLKQSWFGNGGSCDWTKHNISKDSIWVSLSTYSINLRRRNFEAFNVELHGSLQHDEDKLRGYYFDGLSFNPKRNNVIYPGFISDNNSVIYYNIFENVDAKGCIELSGNKMILFGKHQEDVQLIFSQKNQSFIKATSKRFKIQDSGVFSENSKINLLWNNDSIVHPQLKLFYDRKNKILNLSREKVNLGFSPIRSSYHQLDCFFNRMEWHKDSASLFFFNDHHPALIESFDFYNESRYDDIAFINKRHPILILRKMSRDNDDQREFLLDDVAKYYNCSVKDADILMTDFTVMGFVHYSSDTNKIHLNDKLFNFLDSRFQNYDYDSFKIVSKATSEHHAKMDLISGELSINGVNQVELSDSNEVTVIPLDGSLVINKNRDFIFDGIIKTGPFSLYGKRINFIYDSFCLDLNKIDSLQYTVPSNVYQNDGDTYDLKVNTILSDLTGKLYIDEPSNKSGQIYQPNYPKLHISNDSYVYYDKIKNGVYEKDLFSFKVDPFQLDSLLTVKTENIKFPGTLNAPTIFKSFRDTLRLNDTLNLSFTHLIKNKYSVYNGKGYFTNILYLDNSGLSGKGSIYYLNSVAETDSVFFYPQEAIASANTYKIYEQSHPFDCPKVSVSKATINWRAYMNEMESVNRSESFKCFKENFHFDGQIVLSFDSLSASGQFNFENAFSESNYFNFKRRCFTADSSLFRLSNLQGEDKIMIGRNLFSSFNFDQDFGSFRSLDDQNGFELFKNRYDLYFELMEWDRDNHSCYFTGFDDQEGLLITLDPCQDSLSLFARSAHYNLLNYNIDVNGVSKILMSLATIVPDSSYVNILPNGEINFLKNAILNLDSETQTQYDFYNADLYLHSANSLSGKATFDYLDIEESNQAINFTNFVLNDRIFSANASIDEKFNFQLSPYFSFKGKVNFDSSKDYLLFNGETRVTLECDKLNQSWVPFNSYVDPDGVFIDLNFENEQSKQKYIHNGILKGVDRYYASFLGYAKKSDDIQLIGSNGIVKFDNLTGEYVSASKNKIENINSSGNITIYNPDECTLYSEGEINLGAHSGSLKVDAFGFILSHISNDSIAGIIDLSLDFLLHKKAAKMIFSSIHESLLSEVVDQSSLIHQDMLSHQLGRRLLKKYNLKKSKGKRFIPSEFKHTFYFPQLRMSWNSNTSSFISDFELPINNIDGKKIDLMVPGVIEIKPQSSGDYINLYIELASDNYYFFKYRNGKMTIISSDDEFNNFVSELPDRQKFKRGNKKSDSFQYDVVNLGTPNKFLERINW